jgi:hypothetical protein
MNPLHPEQMRKWGWRVELDADLERIRQLTEIHGRISVYQTAGRRDWQIPQHEITRLDSWPPIETECPVALVISDRLVPIPPELSEFVGVYRPASLMIGMDWLDEPDADFELAAVLANFLNTQGLSLQSLAGLALSQNQSRDPQLHAFGEQLSVPVLGYPQEKLFVVRQYTECRAEAAAMLAAGPTELLVRSVEWAGWRLAVARRKVPRT